MQSSLIVKFQASCNLYLKWLEFWYLISQCDIRLADEVTTVLVFTVSEELLELYTIYLAYKL